MKPFFLEKAVFLHNSFLIFKFPSFLIILSKLHKKGRRHVWEIKPLDTHSTAKLPGLASLNKIQAFFEKPVYFSKKDPNFERFEKSHCFSLGNFCNLDSLVGIFGFFFCFFFVFFSGFSLSIFGFLFLFFFVFFVSFGFLLFQVLFFFVIFAFFLFYCFFLVFSLLFVFFFDFYLLLFFAFPWFFWFSLFFAFAFGVCFFFGFFLVLFRFFLLRFFCFFCLIVFLKIFSIYFLFFGFLRFLKMLAKKITRANIVFATICLKEILTFKHVNNRLWLVYASSIGKHRVVIKKRSHLRGRFCFLYFQYGAKL